MDSKSIHRIPREKLEHLLAGIPFFKAVNALDADQYALLLGAARLGIYAPGEQVLHKGAADTWIFFLLKGRLAVFTDRPDSGSLINYITPGEVFGDLAQLIGYARTATVIADPSARESMVLELDAGIFGPLHSEAPINRATKLLYYRNMAHNLRWKLEVYRAQHLQHELANKHRSIKLYHGPKDSREELIALYEQSKALALLLLEWNHQLGTPAEERLQADRSFLSPE